MVVEYRKGEEHINADAMSRLPPCEQCFLKHKEPMKRRNVKVYDELTVEKTMENDDHESEKVLYNMRLNENNWGQDDDDDIQTIIK